MRMRQSGSGSSSRILFELFMIEDIEMVECSSFRDQTTLGNIDILDGRSTLLFIVVLLLLAFCTVLLCISSAALVRAKSRDD